MRMSVPADETSSKAACPSQVIWISFFFVASEFAQKRERTEPDYFPSYQRFLRRHLRRCIPLISDRKTTREALE
jgi:hypothetical protein